jgi:VanZ family protein
LAIGLVVTHKDHCLGGNTSPATSKQYADLYIFSIDMLQIMSAYKIKIAFIQAFTCGRIGEINHIFRRTVMYGDC